MASEQSLQDLPQKPESKTGCILGLVTAALGGWSVLAVVIYLGAVGVSEQELMMKVYPPADLRWLYTVLLGLGVGLPGLLAWLLGKSGRLGQIGRIVALTGLLVVVQAGARAVKVQESQMGLALQLIGILFFLLLLFLLETAAGRSLPMPRIDGLGWVLAAGGGLGLPWVIFCALGSPLDALLALAVSAAAGAALVLMLQPVLRHKDGEIYSYGAYFLDGFVAALALLPVAAALGTNGSGTMLAVSVPWLGWVAAGIHLSIENGKKSNWPAGALLICLGFFWALTFVDLEELSILLLAPNEAAQWGWIAGILSAVLGGILMMVSILLVRHWPARPAHRIAGWACAAMVWLILAFAYFGLGKPGFYGERLFVILKDQADVSSAAKISDPIQRRTEVYRQLVAHADRTQAGLRQALRLRGVPFTPFYLVNAVEVQGEPLLRFWLLARPEVDRVLIDTRLRPLPNIPAGGGGQGSSQPQGVGWNLKLIAADRVWNELGVTGQGILVGQSDTGVQGDHPELAGSYLRRTPSNDYSWFDPWYGIAAPRDYGDHGTHTLGTILGKNVGVAPGAQWIACVNLARNLGNPALYLNCMQFHLAPFPQHGDPLHDGRPEWGAQVLNNSWGCPPLEGCDPQTLLYAVRALRSAGVFVVVSAGNDGEEGCGTVADPPALYSEVTSVGAVDRSGVLVPFSSLGPVTADGSERTKPDVLAPGQEVLSSVPHNSYAGMSGTSMAGPHVVGVVALMWSANPALIGDIARTEEILHRTAAQPEGSLPQCGTPAASGTPNNAAGYGIVNAYEAVLEAQKLK